MNTANTADLRTRFIFDHTPVRGLHVRLDDVWRHIATRKHYPLPVRRALGELLAAAVLIAGNLKQEGSLILQVQGEGGLKLLVAEANSDGTCRATARWDEETAFADNAPLIDLLGGSGIFALTMQPRHGEQWQGMVPLEGGSIAAMLTAYMARSEQIQTCILLAADDHTAASLMLQRLPGETPDEEGWNHLLTLAGTVGAQELADTGAQQLLYRLFHETPPRVFPAEAVEFGCTCSRDKVGNMLRMLGAEEVGRAIAEEGSITADCDFCSQKYTFGEAEADALFGCSVAEAARHPAGAAPQVQ